MSVNSQKSFEESDFSIKSEQHNGNKMIKRFLIKYFWEGQKLTEGQIKARQSIPKDAE